MTRDSGLLFSVTLYNVYLFHDKSSLKYHMRDESIITVMHGGVWLRSGRKFCQVLLEKEQSFPPDFEHKTKSAYILPPLTAYKYSC